MESATQANPQQVKPNIVLTAFRNLRYYKINIIFPSLVAWAIWSDYSHTQEWKAKKALEGTTTASSTAS
jgi:hypothetical protein